MFLENEMFVLQRNKDDNEKKRKVIGNMQVICENKDSMYTENLFGKENFNFSEFSLFENFNVKLF